MKVRFLCGALLAAVMLLGVANVAMAMPCPPSGHGPGGHCSAPEIDPTALGPALAAIGGGILMLAGKRKR